MKTITVEFVAEVDDDDDAMDLVLSRTQWPASVDTTTIIVTDIGGENDEETDVDDDFPMYVEYDGLWGGSDFAADEAAAREDAYEASFFDREE